VRVVFLAKGGSGVNAIDQWSECLAAALARLGHEASSVRWTPGRLSTLTARADVLVIPYNPFMWGRRGFAPRLVLDVLVARLRRRRPLLALAVHEPYVPIRDSRSLLMGAWQRFQLVALLLLVDRRFASIERWVERFDRIRPTLLLPSGSNLPDARSSRERMREELQANGDFVVATLSTGNPSHLVRHVEATLEQLAARLPEVVFLQLGAGAPEVRAPEGVRRVAPGRLPAARLAAHLAAADLFLVPFVDGVSSRRGSFVAGLCEEVCVLGTNGKLTDSRLAGAGLELVDPAGTEVFASRAVELALDSTRRARAAERGRRLFELEFAWDVIASRLLEAVS
jgi:glycosyltransferase involved in cell wall biosynthesis